MRIHLIAIGERHAQFALALSNAGHKVTGSDDQIFEPSRGRLERAGLLPARRMARGPHHRRHRRGHPRHARTDNPELQRAQDLD